MRASSAEMNTSSNYPKLNVPNWVPPAVRYKAVELHAEAIKRKDKKKRIEILNRLISDPLMKRVWVELYRRDRQNGRFFNPAATNVTWARECRERAIELRQKGGSRNDRDAALREAEAKSYEAQKNTETPQDAQDRVARSFLFHAFHAALDNKPVYYQELKEKVEQLSGIAEHLEHYGVILESFNFKTEAAQLRDVAQTCEWEACNTLPRRGPVPEDESIYEPKPDDPWVLTRKSKDDELRTFVIDLAIAMVGMFRKTLDGTLANVSNVVFNRKDVSANNVRDILRNQNFFP
jgi:hypothetical protein